MRTQYTPLGRALIAALAVAPVLGLAAYHVVHWWGARPRATESSYVPSSPAPRASLSGPYSVTSSEPAPSSTPQMKSTPPAVAPAPPRTIERPTEPNPALARARIIFAPVLKNPPPKANAAPTSPKPVVSHEV